MTQPDLDEADESRCWCCGSAYPDDELVRLGDHPEVTICGACARDLHRRARDQHHRAHPTATTRARSILRRAREFAIDRRWHERPVIGPVLRWIDRFLP